MTIQERMFAQLAEKAIFEQAKRYAFEYVDGVNGRSVYPTPEAIENLSQFDATLPDAPQDPSDILEQLHTVGSPATVAQTGGRYFGFVNGNAVPTALAARWLADVWDQNPALHVMSPVVAKLEQLCERWCVELLGLPPQTTMGLVSGTSIATFCGLAAGRYALLKKLGWNVNEDGLFGAPPLRVIVSEQAHSSVFRALALLGLGSKLVELVPADAQGRIDAAQLPELDASCLIILQAGNVNTGAFDDFETICQKANKAGAWVHIDGAFGLWAAASPKLRHLTNGLPLADSWSVDGHKTLNTPYDCALVLCKHPDAHRAAMQTSAAYLPSSDQRDSMMLTPDMSRRARAVELWATLRALGKTGIAEMIETMCARAAQFGALLTENGFQVQNDVLFNQVLVKCDSPAETEATLKAIQASGECWCGGTTWRGEPAIRVSVCSWATTAADVERSVATFMATQRA